MERFKLLVQGIALGAVACSAFGLIGLCSLTPHVVAQHHYREMLAQQELAEAF